MHILIRADASKDIGTGHVMRCLSLAEALKKLGSITFITKDYAGNMIDRIIDKGFSVETIAKGANASDDLISVKKLIKGLEAKVVVTDSYDIDERYLRGLKGQGVILVSIDDMAEIFFSSDIVVNQNLGAQKYDYKTEPNTKKLLGPDFAILRDEIILSGRESRTDEKVKNILVTLGGADPGDQTAKVVKALELLQGAFSVTVVLGAAYPFKERLEQQIKGVNSKIKLEYNAKEMSSLMKKADVAVSAGGTTCYELAYFGVPNIILSLADNQKNISAEFDRQGVSISLGDSQSVSEENISAALQKLIDDPEKRTSMSKKGRSLVDGEGKKRILQELEAIL